MLTDGWRVSHLSAKTIIIRLAIACAVLAPWFLTKLSTAGYSSDDYRTHVLIDGRDYGYFDNINDLNEIVSVSDRGDFRKITLTRDFVTDPSLYLWAKNMMRDRSELKDVHLVMENRDGEEMSRFVLKFVQPLTWTVEAANPALGGFHEKIDLAVQEIAVR